MLRDTLKQEIEQLSESQLIKVADFITLVKLQTQHASQNEPMWQCATAAQRVQNFRAWVEQLPKTGLSLPDEAFNRDSIYEDRCS
ncbi:MAG: hypothetical protein F6K21_12590 [Symploca sp. SIO2D2]|nr:hypothetical protein [Symploca sp. SIO2D2]